MKKEKSLTRQQKRKVIRFAKKIGMTDTDFEPTVDYVELRRGLLAIHRAGRRATREDVLRLMRGDPDVSPA